ncbi:hypothetical protein [Aestuariimicrobium sp. T2.26MG-19.2B]|uniref:hypothetical protein n=1 Tax=Aestuariimicrobium sp. T2.26MG-19.2B TaxID=3040679 RepID=UPI0024776D5A|nr:hypothetical protein [Aestuariimicrobium sp. T2.26MG-19.2B]CAI9408149.1 hypothetical protein AESSP_01969 [Aestuariimicrobium sp. T2.26MG-19.2B]
MPRRVNLPGASELFRPTQSPRAGQAARPGQPGVRPDSEPDDGPAGPAATGRVRHDEKITVYVSSDELIALEQARLTLRQQGVVADRGKIVRTAIAMALAGLAENGEQSDLVRQLTQP